MEMHFLSLLLLVAILLLIKNPAFCSGDNKIRCIEKEREALLNVNPTCRYINNTIYWHPRDCCEWPGVYCSNHTGHVYRLSLGLFSTEFCQLTDEQPFMLNASLLALNELVDLEFSYYGGHIPGFIGSFHKLRYLNLSAGWYNDSAGRYLNLSAGSYLNHSAGWYNHSAGRYLNLTRSIPPQLGNLTRLKSLEISAYCCDDTPRAWNLEWLSQLTSLKRLVLRNIDLSEARDWVRVTNNLPSLTFLDLHGCRLPNSPPSLLSSANSSKSLTFVDLSDNNLQASVLRTWLFNHSSIKQLYLSFNQLNGSFPSELSNLPSLSHLDLSSNYLQGGFSNSIQGFCGLQMLDLSANNLTDDLPTIFKSLSCSRKYLTSLVLHHNKLTGSVPDFTQFSSLRKLNLHDNILDGSLPSIFRKTSELIILNLQNNQLTGSVPDLSVFSSLKVLHLQHNRLNGSVHLGLGKLPCLEKLDLSSNSLKGQILEDHFSNHSRLHYLDLSFNFLRFDVTYSWVPPFRLRVIGLASCRLGPRFPTWLRTQLDYSMLDLSNAGISDTIPLWFWNISSVTTLISLSHNKLRGILPNSSVVLVNKPAIDLSSNLLKGPIPPFLANAQYLNLSRNSFSGPISFLCRGIAYYKHMYGLDLSHNFLSGKLTNCWMKLALSVMDLSSNNFIGNLPSSLGSLNGLVSLHLRNNRLSGKLPLSLRNLTNLIHLDLGGNRFSGDIPTWIAHSLPTLTVLSLSNNSFSGTITPQLCELSSLRILDLSLNNISGTIPNCLCNLKAMRWNKKNPADLIRDINGTFPSIGSLYKDYIFLALKGFMYEYKNSLELVKSFDLSGNKLEGKIPAEISCLTGLISFNLSRNNLTGPITPKIGELKDLETLDLSNNHLSGEIPASLSSLNFLNTLNLANNNLSGSIPMGTQIQSFDASMFEGNPKLCGDPLPKKCPGDGNGKGDDGGNNSNWSGSEGDDDKDGSLGLYISIVLGFIVGFWGVCGSLVLKRSWRYAYFRIWDRAYDKLFVIRALMVGRIQRWFQV